MGGIDLIQRLTSLPTLILVLGAIALEAAFAYFCIAAGEGVSFGIIPVILPAKVWGVIALGAIPMTIVMYLIDVLDKARRSGRGR